MEEGEGGRILSYSVSPGCRAESLVTGAPLSPCPCFWDHSPLNNFPAGSGGEIVIWHCYFFLTLYVIFCEKYKVDILFNKSLIIDFFPGSLCWIPHPQRERVSLICLALMMAPALQPGERMSVLLTVLPSKLGQDDVHGRKLGHSCQEYKEPMPWVCKNSKSPPQDVWCLLP